MVTAAAAAAAATPQSRGCGGEGVGGAAKSTQQRLLQRGLDVMD
jgi:hypothetical protein